MIGRYLKSNAGDKNGMESNDRGALIFRKDNLTADVNNSVVEKNSPVS